MIKDFPTICGNEDKIKEITSGKRENIYASVSDIEVDEVQSSFGIALHMHQPTIPASSDDLRSASLISNLQYMMEHQEIGDNHDAPVFLWCYSRMSDFVRELCSKGKSPRVMLDYSGNLLWGLKQMGEEKVLDNLRRVTCDETYYHNVEWLGTMWSHSVVSSTPLPDIKLHIRAWQEHFASLFGLKVLKRVKGFSAPEMHLPIHPDMCYEYVKSLKECGYEWLMAQEHTIENTDGSGVGYHDFPHKLVAKNSLGQTEEIVVLIKKQGSDTKLVAQMQPYYEAKGRMREEYRGRMVFPYILQIGDGENGGVMMNEFPRDFMRTYEEIDREGTVPLNGSEYLESIRRLGVSDSDFIPVQPISQKRIWDCINGFSEGAADKAIEKLKSKDPGFNLDKASWTNDISWVRGYGDVLDPINKLSVEFHRRFDKSNVDKENSDYKEAFLYLLLSQTSCFRYWGRGIWTEYVKEICRRGMEVLKRSRRV
ncbi:MAG: glycosyl hydrolase family 57 [Pseudomonadota bacterium]